MPPEQGEFLLAKPCRSTAGKALRARVPEARDAVAARPAGLDQADAVSALPAELAEHAGAGGDLCLERWLVGGGQAQYGAGHCGRCAELRLQRPQSDCHV